MKTAEYVVSAEAVGITRTDGHVVEISNSASGLLRRPF
jgi:hypothetical protein